MTSRPSASPPGRAGARPATYDEAGRARAVVTSISWKCAAARGCLQRSIATALLCRMSGTFPTWYVGVRIAPPFGAHAWVAAEGRDVDEPYPAGYHQPPLTVAPRSGPAHRLIADEETGAAGRAVGSAP
ncbi:lasso peptide biosynthesis B2 protein [Streptomyces griseocarneus]|uniref:lasso peptide biosynthesis B2 protein n=1 Tax=Streptomyces griseocarneus TaxID=51201 RepID=UPI00167E9E2D|nr:lasso peptide biosynthesis B2 protein [Streptomyces griseocarneus]MBZ6475124.1 lasso peptide biosynthesis B2 protein [Streptomyces griseocarneus]GHG62131.1 hypothetical protein GCM10018779_30560 [Streptomyces griseocarneus]